MDQMFFRTLRTGDMERCAEILRPPAGACGLEGRSLAALWRELLQEERISGGVVVQAPEADGVLAFSVTGFVDETFLYDYLTAPKPYLASRLYEVVRAKRSLLLHPRDVREANTAGTLNFIILHFSVAPALDPETGHAAAASAQVGFRLAHGGYRIRRLLQEAHGPHELAMLGNAGLLVKSDYSEYFAMNGVSEPLKAERPVLMGLYRDDPESRLLGTAAASAFQYSEPRFYFSPREQRVLGRAVLDESDEEIACELGVSASAVKKAWRRAYERVDAIDPGLLAGEVSGAESARGKEKRRNLVRYLRYHLYELRPIARRSGCQGSADRGSRGPRR